MNDKGPNGGMNDHDLLVILSTKMDRAIQDIANLGLNLAQKVQDLQHEKQDREESDKFQDMFTKQQTDHEKRIRFIEKYLWTAVGIIALAEFLIGVYHK